MTMRRVVLILAMLVIGGASAAWAVQPDEVLSNPQLETRARALSQQLRCMVCQNESIDDSNAPLAHDLRVLVRERLTSGDTDRQVLDFLVARYGEFILLKPPFNWHTALLWIVPPGALLIGAGALVVLALRRGRGTAGSPAFPGADALTAEEQERLAKFIPSDGSEVI
jgi:cytochrome c-type biogenesis protein CcmH